MQRQHNAEEPDMMLIEHPATEEPGSDIACKITPRDENVFTLASPGKPVADDQVDVASSPHINVDSQTVFANVSAPQQRRKIYIAGIMVLAMTAIFMQVFYFSHVALPIVNGVFPADAVVTRQISAAAYSLNDEASGLTSVESPVTTGKEYAENFAENVSKSGKTDDETSGQREERPSILADDNARAEVSGAEISDATVPITIPAQVIKTETDTAESNGHDTHVDTKEIRIIRGHTPDRTGALLNAAYTAYVSGNYSDARRAYLDVLKDLPDNRDALLGMAAIAWRTSAPEEASRFWLQVLADYPDDPVATAALINLMADQDYTGNTRTIGKLLQDDPRAAFLYFSLGNLHAATFRWPEAQRAFAEASRLEGDNPDYAYNLAVCLEHAGDRRAALDYYRTALELAQSKPVNFNSSVVVARITALAEIAHGR